MEAKIIEYLMDNGMTKFSGEFGTITATKRVSVKQPDTPENKALFYDWLKSKGDFDDMISVNSNKLTSYIKAELEIEGPGFIAPGLQEATVTRTVSYRKK